MERRRASRDSGISTLDEHRIPFIQQLSKVTLFMLHGIHHPSSICSREAINTSRHCSNSILMEPMSYVRNVRARSTHTSQFDPFIVVMLDKRSISCNAKRSCPHCAASSDTAHTAHTLYGCSIDVLLVISGSSG